jgi:hypothetical protein
MAASTSDGTETTSGDAEPCDMVNQDCGEGMKCVPFSPDGGLPDSAHCIPAPRTPSAPGQACKIDSGLFFDQIDDCGAGSFCFYHKDDLTGVCVEFCDPVQGCADPGTGCKIFLEEWLNLCVASCDPLQPQSQCPDGGICQRDLGSFICTQKVTVDDKEFGQQCDGWDCKPGLVCVNSFNVPGCDGCFCCTEYCDVTDPVACQAHPPQECVPFFGMDNQQWGHVGSCLVP